MSHDIHIPTRLIVALLVAPIPVNASAAPASASFKPTVAATAQPILDRLAGDQVPLDNAGLGGTQFDRVPLDPRTGIERAIEADMAEALNDERTAVGLPALDLSDHLTAIERRWVEQLASDESYPNCPTLGSDHVCDAAAPYFDRSTFENGANGLGATVVDAGGGALDGAGTIRPGAFAVGLMNSPGHRAAVWSRQMSFMGVGVKCGLDGRTYMVWDGAAVDPAVIFADPPMYEGAYNGPVSDIDFGHRCPQPAPKASLAQSGPGRVTVTPSSATILTPCRLRLHGPLLDGGLRFRAMLRNAATQAVVDTAEWSAVFTATGYLTHDFSGLPAGDYVVELVSFNDCETSQPTQVLARVTGDGVQTGAQFVAIEPVREIDTRETGQRLRADVPTTFALAEVPATATAVTVNVTAVDPAAAGWLVVHPCGAPTPTSSLNFAGGETVANQVTVGVSDRRLCVTANVATDVVIDLAGIWVPGITGAAPAPTVTRLWDTRAQRGINGLGVLELDVGAQVDAGARAVSLNVTATNVAADGYVTVWPCTVARPLVSNLNPAPQMETANLATVKVDGSASRVCIYVSQPMDLVVDLSAVWRPPDSGRSIHPRAVPERLLDTRLPGSGGRIEAGIERRVVEPQPGSLVLNATVDRPAAPGWVAIYPCADGYQGTSTVNFAGTRANGVLVDATGGACALASTALDLVIDETATID